MAAYIQDTGVGRGTIRNEQITEDSLITATFIGATGTGTDPTFVDVIEEATTTIPSITRCQGRLLKLSEG